MECDGGVILDNRLEVEWDQLSAYKFAFIVAIPKARRFFINIENFASSFITLCNSFENLIPISLGFVTIPAGALREGILYNFVLSIASNGEELTAPKIAELI